MEPPSDRRAPAPRPAEPRAIEPAQPATTGSLVFQVQPGGAEILIDGTPWDGPEGDERLVVAVPEGRHRVEVRKEGYATFTTEVAIRRSETTPLNVSLAK
jgi:hypothetical protein